MIVKMVKVKVHFKVEQEFVMPETIYEGMTTSDWFNMFRGSVTDGEVIDYDIDELDDIEPEEDNARD